MYFVFYIEYLCIFKQLSNLIYLCQTNKNMYLLLLLNQDLCYMQADLYATNHMTLI